MWVPCFETSRASPVLPVSAMAAVAAAAAIAGKRTFMAGIVIGLANVAAAIACFVAVEVVERLIAAPR